MMIVDVVWAALVGGVVGVAAVVVLNRRSAGDRRTGQVFIATAVLAAVAGALLARVAGGASTPQVDWWQLLIAGASAVAAVVMTAGSLARRAARVSD